MDAQELIDNYCNGNCAGCGFHNPRVKSKCNLTELLAKEDDYHGLVSSEPEIK